MQPTGSALQQARQQFQQLQGSGQPQSGGQSQAAQGAAQNPLEQSFMQFLQQQHGQTQNSFLNYLPWFNQGQNQPQGQQLSPTQQQIQAVGQTAFSPPQQAPQANAPLGSGQELSNRSQQQQSNTGGDMASFFSGSAGYI